MRWTIRSCWIWWSWKCESCCRSTSSPGPRYRSYEGGGDPGDPEASGDGSGDVQEAPGRRAGGRQRGGVAARNGEGRGGAWDGSGEAGVDHAAHEVQGGGLRSDEGRGRSSHAVFHGLPSAVLLSDDGRDGSGDVSEWSGDGDAG